MMSFAAVVVVVFVALFSFSEVVVAQEAASVDPKALVRIFDGKWESYGYEGGAQLEIKSADNDRIIGRVIYYPVGRTANVWWDFNGLLQEGNQLKFETKAGITFILEVDAKTLEMVGSTAGAEHNSLFRFWPKKETKK
jgi:hypothetical protein